MYKLIALDMDGTVLNDKKEITKRTKDAIAKAKEIGVKVVLSSGRPIDGLYQFLEKLDLVEDDEYILSYNGCLVQENKSKKIIHEVVLDKEDLNYIYDLSVKLGVNMQAFSTKRGLITPKISKYTEYEAMLNNIDITVTDFSDMENDEYLAKIMMLDEPEILDEAISKLPKEAYEKYNIVKSTPFFLEIINKNGDKGEGLKALGEYLGIKREEMIAIGDAANDISMIEYAGLGVAMANASEDVKKVADLITVSNEEDGVAKVIEEYILNLR